MVGKPPLLRVKDLSRNFGGLQALFGVSFDIVPGDTIGVIGPNDAGKTTLFAILSGFLALAVSAFCTALMGAFYAHYVHFLNPDSAFDGSWSVLPIVASLFGGMRTLIGPSFWGLADYLPR